MSIDRRYFDYLDHFGTTAAVVDAYDHMNAANIIALRHDVDHDLDLALEMGYWEHERNIRSSYYLLHTAEYWDDPRRIDKALQLQDFGHEVGLHVNVLTEWIAGTIDDVEGHLRDLIQPLREAGLMLGGVSAHGDRACYQGQYINYWCFRELRGEDPAQSESARSPEGIRVDDQEQQIHYPASHRLSREDGSALDLWSVSLADLGLKYDAVHVPHDRYFTDTGGIWSRTPDPLTQNLDHGRIQVLMHPIYYRGPPQLYFFLSTARSGSKWLANFLDRATGLTAKHEFTLNHRLDDGNLVADHRTGAGFVNLQKSPAEARQLMIDQRNWREDQTGDYAEANIYLPTFQTEFEEIFPDAVTVHLYRHPKDVVRSLLNRDWYDTPDDDRHPEIPINDWTRLSQFEKCCWYVRYTNEELARWCRYQMCFENMTSSLDWLSRFLRELHIPVFPRLAEAEHVRVINASRSTTLPAYDSWTQDMKETFAAICEPVLRELRYKSDAPVPSEKSLIEDELTTERLAVASRRLTDPDTIQSKMVYATNFDRPLWRWFRCQGCSYSRQDSGLVIKPERDRHAHLVFAGNGWSSQSRWGRRPWKARTSTYYRLSIDGYTSPRGKASIYCLMYDKQGKLLTQRSLGRLDSRVHTHRHSFRVRCDASHFTLGLYISQGTETEWVRVNSIKLEALPMLPAV